MEVDLPSSWPIPWVDPGNWTKFVLNKSNGLILSQSPYRQQQSRHSESLSNSSEIANVMTPFDRYEISKKVMEMLEDPKKKDDLDMSDPLVKTVYEAVLVEDPSLNSSPAPTEDQTPAKLVRVLDEGEFIAFNPLVSILLLAYCIV